MMTSKILKFVKSSKTQQSQYLENETFFFCEVENALYDGNIF